MGKCQVLINRDEQCEFDDKDGQKRKYKCIPGYKCAKVIGNEWATCIEMYSFDDGIASPDA